MGVKDLDTNGDGRIDTKDQVGDDELASLGIPALGATQSGRGAPLWPYDASDPTTLDALTVENKSRNQYGFGTYHGIGGNRKGPERVGARYFEEDTLQPLRWSPEQRASLQRQLYAIGLYGNEKVRLGSWSATDQAVFTELLASSNVEGRTWQNQLGEWKKMPPVELLERIKGSQPKKPTIRKTNPVDIRLGAEDVSRSLTGRVDRKFTEAAVPGYQKAEVGAQQAQISDQEMGGGGTVTDAPSLQGFLADKLRREQPLEVDGYAFMNAFDTFADMIGAR